MPRLIFVQKIAIAGFGYSHCQCLYLFVYVCVHTHRPKSVLLSAIFIWFQIAKIMKKKMANKYSNILKFNVHFTFDGISR